MQLWGENTAGRGTSKGKALACMCLSCSKNGKKANCGLQDRKYEGQEQQMSRERLTEKAVEKGGLWWWSH